MLRAAVATDAFTPRRRFALAGLPDEDNQRLYENDDDNEDLFVVSVRFVVETKKR